MFEILAMELLAPKIKRAEISAPLVARHARAGQFIILRLHEKGERIPLTLFKTDKEKGTVQIVFKENGKTTHQLGGLQPGDHILDVVGPLGKPTHVENFGTVVVIGGGVGSPIAYAVAKALREGGNHIIGIIGFRSQNLVVLEEDMREVCHELLVSTDDGSYGKKGFTTHVLQELVDAGRKIDYVFSVGPVLMMKATAEITHRHEIKTVSSVNPIMVDGTGMCGACRVCTKQGIQFACVDGPEFDAHEIDYDELFQRLNEYQKEEQQALERYLEES